MTHTKVAKVILSGEPGYFQPFGLLLKGFYFFIKYFLEKEEFFKCPSNLNNIKSNFYMTFRFYFSIFI